MPMMVLQIVFGIWMYWTFNKEALSGHGRYLEQNLMK